MATFTQEEIDALYAPFPLEAHTTREGHMNKAKTKIQWFTYLDRAAVQRRLESLFPGEWSVDIIETHRESDYVTVSLKMTIRGISRSCNGGQSLKFSSDTIDEDKEKGAWTEAFRRVASVWGIGLYIYEMDYAIWTDAYEDNNWDQKRQREDDAKVKFAQWYKRQFPQASNGGSTRPAPPSPTTTGQPIPAQPTPSTNGKHEDKPAQPKNAAPVTPVTVVVNNDTKIEALSGVKAEEYMGKGNKKGIRFVTSTGSYSYTRKPFQQYMNCDEWTKVGNYTFDGPFNVISTWYQPEDPKSQAYWRIDRLEPIGAAEAELFGEQERA